MITPDLTISERLFIIMNKTYLDLLHRNRNNLNIFQKKYKFSIAFENNYSSGYTTEKILQAFAAKTIPIYWGNPRIAEDFNPQAFINCHDYLTFEEAINRIIEVDNNDNIYMQMMKAPIINDPHANLDSKILGLQSFFTYICDQELGTAFRRNRARWGTNYERNLRKRSSLIIHLKSEFKTLVRNMFKLLRFRCNRSK